MVRNSPPDNGKKTSTSASHKSNGQFAKGNKCSKGMPYMKDMAQVRKMIFQTIGENNDLVKKTIEGVLEQCSLGNMEAIKWIFPYIIGNPETNINLNAQLDAAVSVAKKTMDQSKLTKQERKELKELHKKCKGD